MLDTNTKTQLKAYLEKLTKPVELIATLDDSAKSARSRNCWLKSLNCQTKLPLKKTTRWRYVKPSFLITNQVLNQGPRFLLVLPWDMSSPH